MHPDQLIIRLAARQHGIVTRQHLVHAGLSPQQVDRRFRRGALDPVHRGVFKVGPIEDGLWPEMAASLACGTGAVVSHLSAAVVWDVWPGAPGRTVHVSTRNGLRPRKGIILHRAYGLRPEECTRRLGIRVTTLPRTLLDVAAVAPVHDVERILAEALSRRLVREKALRTLLEQHRGERGTGVLGSLLRAGPVHTRSEAEDRFLALMREAKLPPPQVNVRIEGYEVDFYWHDAALVVEVDGLRFHRTTAAFRRDRQRDGELLRAGLRVLRVTWDQLTGDRLAFIALLAQTLVPAVRGRPRATRT